VKNDSVLIYTKAAAPSFTVSSARDSVCPRGDTTQLSSTGGLIYAWTPSAAINDTTFQNPVGTLTTTTTFQLSARSTADGCDSVKTVTVYVECCGDTIPPYITGTNAVKVNDSTYRVMFSEPIKCNTVSTGQFSLDTLASGTTTTSDFLANGIFNVTAYNCATWVGGIDTTRWVTVELNNPVPSGYNEDWFIELNNTVAIQDTCDSIAAPDPVGSGVPGAGAGDGQALILPVELLFFTGQLTGNETVLLNWEAALERNMSHYEVQRSTDANYFSPFGTQSARGAGYQYGLEDREPQTGVNYYRLKAVDEDGRFSYSHVVAIEINTGGFQLVGVRPIPTIDKITISLMTASPQDIRIEVTNILGERVLSNQVKTTAGSNDIPLNISDLEAGIYYLNIKDNKDHMLIKKIIKQ